MPLATREAPAAEPRAGAGGDAEGNFPTSSISSGRANFGDINGSNSSSSDDTRTSSVSSNSNGSRGLPALVGRPARDLEVFGTLSSLESVRTKSEPRGLTMSASCADALLARAMRTVKAKRIVKEEAAEIERAIGSLLENAWRMSVSGSARGAREAGCAAGAARVGAGFGLPLSLAAEQQPKLSIPSTFGREPNQVESPPHTVAGVEQSVYWKG